MLCGQYCQRRKGSKIIFLLEDLLFLLRLDYFICFSFFKLTGYKNKTNYLLVFDSFLQK